VLGGGGFVVGFLLGRMSRDTHDIAVTMDQGEFVDERKRRRRPTYQSVMGVVVVLLGLATAVQGIYQDSATRRVANCTRAYANGFADAIDARSEASAASQNALDGWMTTLDELLTRATPETDTAAARERFRLSTAEYLSKRAEFKKQQAEHPLPPPPRDVCSE
jgi:urease accessory protein UreF